MNWQNFAQTLGYLNEQELFERMEKVFEDTEEKITWFISPLPNGQWVAFNDVDQVKYFKTREEALWFQLMVWKKRAQEFHKFWEKMRKEAK